MRVLSEIIEACKLNEEVSKEELAYAVLSLTYVNNMSSSLLLKLHSEEVDSRKKERIASNHENVAKALNSDPKVWLGWNNDPKNPQYQRFHAMGRKLVDKALKGELPNQKKDEKPKEDEEE